MSEEAQDFLCSMEEFARLIILLPPMRMQFGAGGVQSRARRRNCRHSNSAPAGPEAPAKAGSSGPTKMQELAGNGAPPATAASPASTSQNWPPPAFGAGPAIAVEGGSR